MRRFLLVLVVGAAATFTMDTVNGLLARTGLIHPVNHELIGRILSAWLKGQVRFASPAAIPAVEHARALGFAYHYAIGIVLAGVYLALARARAASLVRAVAFGLATSAFSLFLLFPSAGIGVLGLRSGSTAPLVSSLANHLFFGLGLYLALQVLRLVAATPAVSREGAEA